MDLPELFSLAAMALLLFGLWRYRIRTDALISFAMGLFLVISAVATATSGFEGLTSVGPWILALWALTYSFYAYALRRDAPVPERGAAFDQITEAWGAGGFTQSAAFRLRPGSHHIVYAFRRADDPTTAFLYRRDGAASPSMWFYATPLGKERAP